MRLGWQVQSWWSILLCGSVLVLACGSGSKGDGKPLESGGGTSSAGKGGGSSGVGASSSGGSVGAGKAGSAGSGGSVEPSEPDPTSKAGACVLYARRYCERDAVCRGVGGGQCMWNIQNCPDLLFAEGSTRTVESVVACAKAWPDFPCEQLALGETPDCIEPGTKQVGEPCLFPAQCASLACPYNDGFECNTCKAVASPGQQCGPDLACPGLQGCIEATGVCNYTARPIMGIGSDCSAASCELKNAYCGADMKCVPLRGVGESCAGFELCAYDGIYCRASDSTCQPLPAVGAPCGLGTLDELRCAVNAYCDMAAAAGPTCMALPVAGEPCRAEGRQCAPQHDCEDRAGPPGVCRVLGKKGDACEGDRWCLDDLTCDLVAQICKSRALPEQSCSDGTTACHVASECDGSVCQPLDLQGEFERCLP